MSILLMGRVMQGLTPNGVENPLEVGNGEGDRRKDLHRLNC